MDFQNFENQTFTELPALVIGSNFTKCTFKVAGKFERCNIMESVVEKACYFDRSNVIKCTGDGLDGSTYDKSSRQDEDPEEPEEEK